MLVKLAAPTLSSASASASDLFDQFLAMLPLYPSIGQSSSGGAVALVAVTTALAAGTVGIYYSYEYYGIRIKRTFKAVLDALKRVLVTIPANVLKALCRGIVRAWEVALPALEELWTFLSITLPHETIKVATSLCQLVLLTIPCALGKFVMFALKCLMTAVVAISTVVGVSAWSFCVMIIPDVLEFFFETVPRQLVRAACAIIRVVLTRIVVPTLTCAMKWTLVSTKVVATGLRAAIVALAGMVFLSLPRITLKVTMWTLWLLCNVAYFFVVTLPWWILTAPPSDEGTEGTARYVATSNVKTSQQENPNRHHQHGNRARPPPPTPLPLSRSPPHSHAGRGVGTSTGCGSQGGGGGNSIASTTQASASSYGSRSSNHADSVFVVAVPGCGSYGHGGGYERPSPPPPLPPPPSRRSVAVASHRHVGPAPPLVPHQTSGHHGRNFVVQDVPRSSRTVSSVEGRGMSSVSGAVTASSGGRNSVPVPVTPVSNSSTVNLKSVSQPKPTPPPPTPTPTPRPSHVPDVPRSSLNGPGSATVATSGRSIPKQEYPIPQASIKPNQAAHAVAAASPKTPSVPDRHASSPQMRVAPSAQRHVVEQPTVVRIAMNAPAPAATAAPDSSKSEQGVRQPATASTKSGLRGSSSTAPPPNVAPAATAGVHGRPTDTPKKKMKSPKVRMAEAKRTLNLQEDLLRSRAEVAARKAPNMLALAIKKVFRYFRGPIAKKKYTPAERVALAKKLLAEQEAFFHARALARDPNKRY